MALPYQKLNNKAKHPACLTPNQFFFMMRPNSERPCLGFYDISLQALLNEISCPPDNISPKK